MGIEPYLVASVLEGVLAQRLGRRLAPEHRQHVAMPEDVEHRLTAAEKELFNGQAWISNPSAGDLGFHGRVGFFELIRVNSQLRAGISDNLSKAELIKLLDADFRNMRQDGLLKAAEGVTTIEEVLRATQDVEDELA